MSNQQLDATRSGVARRTFLKGLGLAATTAAISSGTASWSAAAGTASHHLSASAVTLWRRTSRLSETTSFLTRSLGLRWLGGDAGTTYFDAGNLVLACYRQEGSRPAFDTTRPWPGEYELQANPANVLVQVGSRNLLRRDPAAAREEVVDADGNYFRVAAGTPSRRGIDAVRLMVSDLETSADFYTAVLGLGPVPADGRRVVFDLGTLDLELRQESSVGLMSYLHRIGRLAGDSQILRVADVNAAVSALRGRGVRFAYGIEERSVGRVAPFDDPDGHQWVLWQPSSAVTTGGAPFLLQRASHAVPVPGTETAFS